MDAVRVENLSKLYHLGEPAANSLRDAIVNIFKGQPQSHEELWALRDVNFTVKDGETLGIIGRNGAGKSTLLKILSRITKPTAGTAAIRGRIGSLLEVGTGFHHELTGRENIYLNGAVLGMKRSEIATKFDEIVAFSGLEKFLDTPVKHYSSGMYMRLAFAVAAHLDPEVLIVDEVLAVGDFEFQKKCLGKMDEVSRSGRAVLFVSHNLASLAQICQRGILLQNGQLIFDGTIEATIDKYLSLTESKSRFKLEKLDPAKKMQITEAFVTNKNGVITAEVPHNEDFCIEFKARIDQLRKGSQFCVALLNKFKDRVFTELRAVEDFYREGESDIHLKYKIPKNFIAPNQYSFLLQIFFPPGELIENLPDICPFTIIDTGSEFAVYKDYGSVLGCGTWHVE